MLKIFKTDTRWYAAAFIIVLLVSAKFYQPKDIGYVFSICASSCILDFIILCLINRRPSFPLSALVTGLIISGILAPGRFSYIAALAAILSKHILKISERHIFNPAGFGLFIASALLGLPLIWKVYANPLLAVLFGLFLAYRVRKLSLVFSFSLSLLLLSVVYSLIKHQGLWANTWLLNYFFIFFMLIEPRTSPVYLKSKLIYGIIVSIMVMLCFAFLPKYDFLVLGLLLGNAINALLRRKTALNWR